MNSTPPHLIAVVVYTLAILSCVYVGTLAYCVMSGVTIDQVVLTAFAAVGGGIVGTFTGMLINTRSGAKEPTSSSSVTVTKEEVKP